MVRAEQVSAEVSKLICTNGNIARFQYYTSTLSGADYDNEYITGSKAIWGFAMIQPISSVGRDGAEKSYLEQGKITLTDSRLYVAGSIEINQNMKIGLGSPIQNEYKVLAEANIPWSLGSITLPVYNMVWVRNLNAGSFIGVY